MNAAVTFSPETRHACKHAHPQVSDMHSPVCSLVHSETSSLPHQHEGYGMDDAIGTRPRKSGGSYQDRSETRTSLHVRLVQHVTEPSKVVAQKVKASPDSIDSYRQGNVPQSWAQMIAFGRAYPGFALDIMEMMGIDVDRDRNAYALFLSLQKQVRGEP